MLSPPNENPPLVAASGGPESRALGGVLSGQDSKPTREDYTRERYRVDSAIKRILRADAARRFPHEKHASKVHRQIGCTWVVVGDVALVKPAGHTGYHYKGLKICGSVWACPLCASKVQERRRQEVAQAIGWATEFGKGCAMVSYTFPHRVDQPLADLLRKQQQAIAYMRGRRQYIALMKEAGSVGRIRALEVTHGFNGWHPHTHELLFLDSSYDARRLQGRLASLWLRACRKVGLFVEGRDNELSFLTHSVDVTEGDEGAAAYIAKMDAQGKWGISHELTKSSSKQGRRAGSHPFKLAMSSDTSSLFVDYVIAMKGQQQLIWSRGLKHAVGVVEKTDEEIAAEESETVDDRIPLGLEEWALVRMCDARYDLVLAATVGGVGGVVQALRELRARLQGRAYTLPVATCAEPPPR